MSYYVYIIECVNNSYYTGITDNMERRYTEHVQGTMSCKYTRSFPPRRLAVYWDIDADRPVAQRIEHYIKSLSRSEKEVLIDQPSNLSALLGSVMSDVPCLTVGSAATH